MVMRTKKKPSPGKPQCVFHSPGPHCPSPASKPTVCSLYDSPPPRIPLWVPQTYSDVDLCIIHIVDGQLVACCEWTLDSSKKIFGVAGGIINMFKCAAMQYAAP